MFSLSAPFQSPTRPWPFCSPMEAVLLEMQAKMHPREPQWQPRGAPRPQDTPPETPNRSPRCPQKLPRVLKSRFIALRMFPKLPKRPPKAPKTSSKATKITSKYFPKLQKYPSSDMFLVTSLHHSKPHLLQASKPQTLQGMGRRNARSV